MADVQHILAEEYDNAASIWGDKMRTLGYYDAYLGLISSLNFRAPAGHRILDIGAGTAAFSEAWVAINGPDQSITLLDPSSAMLARGAFALRQRNVEPEIALNTLDEYKSETMFDCLLAAHVLEHAEEPISALCDMRRLVDRDARLWLVVSKPHWCNAIIWLKWRHRSYTPATVADMLAKSGWIMEHEYHFPSGPPSRTSRGYLAKAE